MMSKHNLFQNSTRKGNFLIFVLELSAGIKHFLVPIVVVAIKFTHMGTEIYLKITIDKSYQWKYNFIKK